MSHIRHQDGRIKNLEEQLQKAKEDYAAALTAEDDIQQEICVTQTETKFIDDKIAKLDRSRLGLGKQREKLELSLLGIQKK